MYRSTFQEIEELAIEAARSHLDDIRASNLQHGIGGTWVALLTCRGCRASAVSVPCLRHEAALPTALRHHDY